MTDSIPMRDQVLDYLKTWPQATDAEWIAETLQAEMIDVIDALADLEQTAGVVCVNVGGDPHYVMEWVSQ